MFQSKISIPFLFLISLCTAQVVAAPKIYDCRYFVKYLGHKDKKLIKLNITGLHSELGNVKCERKKNEELVIGKEKIFGEKINLAPNKEYLVRILKYRGQSASGLTSGERYFFSSKK